MSTNSAGAKPPNRILDLTELNSGYFQEINRSIQALLASHSELYLHPSKQWEYGWALQQAQLRRDDDILDAGCGASIFPLYLASCGYDVTACDVDMPVRADEQVRYVPASITDLPFSSGSFDKVFCISVIEHLPPEDIGEAMQEFRRVLKPGGKLLLTTDFYEDANAEIWYEGPDRWFKVDWNVFDERSLRKYILDAEGFQTDGKIDMTADWAVTRQQMRAFHGYPYTSIGVSLQKIY